MRVPGGRARAHRASAAGDEHAAADAFSEALAAARSLGRAWPLAAVLADYGLWLVACGRSDDAAPLLVEASALFERMGARRWLDRIAAARPAATAAARG
jgi:Tfp pilus assembly protein PilF